ncbi:MAG: rhomboid family intramembrane serine protease [Thiogranum sp.]
MQPDPDSLKNDNTRLRRSFVLVALFALILWVIKLIEIILGLDFVHYGVYPLRVSGLTGIMMAPLIHGSLSHLFSNTAPLIILGTALLYGYPRSAIIVVPVLYLGTGLGVWLFARSAYHIGASGVTFGIMFFVFTIGVLRWDKRAIILSMIVFFLYGSMIWGIFPTRPGVSFESHFFGAAIGVALAMLLKNHDPAPPPKKYSWEDESDELETEEKTDNQTE